MFDHHAKSTVRVLLIDDDEDSLVLVRALLAKDHREIDFQLDWAGTYEQGLQAIRAREYDVYLLDYRLGAQTGLELLHQIAGEGYREAIVLITGHADRDLDLAALNAGAADFLRKDEVTPAALSRSLLFAIELTRHQLAAASLSCTKDELNLARTIQQRMLRPRFVPSKGFDLAGGCRPATVTAGDFYDIFSVPDGRLLLLVADVSHHGIGPALIMSAIRRMVRTLLRTTGNPGEVLTLANEAVLEDADGSSFVTMFLALLDPSTRTMAYGGAGHEGYILSLAGDVRRLESTAFPLGVVVNADFPIQRVELLPGDILILLTDGFAEALCPKDTFYGIERALTVIRANRQYPAQRILDELFASVRAFCNPWTPQDDMTAVIVKVENDY